jgi:hypothetical protein
MLRSNIENSHPSLRPDGELAEVPSLLMALIANKSRAGREALSRDLVAVVTCAFDRRTDAIEAMGLQLSLANTQTAAAVEARIRDATVASPGGAIDAAAYARRLGRSTVLP